MSSPLVDPEGFPRADIDVYTVRHARAAIVRLRNDHRAVVEEMGRVLQVVYAAREGEGPAIVVERSAVAVQPSGVNGTGRIQTALAKVNAVAPGSPAAQAGMEKNDLILEFGHLDGDNSLADVGALVASSEGVELRIVVRRGTALVELLLTPRPGWGGRGMLGCHILPV
ncbi:putative 26S proteasome regulatory subunit [Naganishia albida]|nr:putative 26S proteasome regulatory subunit [Naganishia albida]